MGFNHSSLVSSVDTFECYDYIYYFLSFQTHSVGRMLVSMAAWVTSFPEMLLFAAQLHQILLVGSDTYN